MVSFVRFFDKLSDFASLGHKVSITVAIKFDTSLNTSKGKQRGFSFFQQKREGFLIRSTNDKKSKTKMREFQKKNWSNKKKILIICTMMKQNPRKIKYGIRSWML